MKYYTLNNETITWYEVGAVEITNPVREDGAILPNHEALSTLTKDADGNFYKYYLQDGTPDVDKIEAEAIGEAVDSIKTAIQSHLDATAFSYGFESSSPMDRAGSYAGYTNKYQTDALTLVTWRANVWDYVDVEFPKVGVSRTMPTADEFLAEIELAVPTPVKA